MATSLRGVGIGASVRHFPPVGDSAVLSVESLVDERSVGVAAGPSPPPHAKAASAIVLIVAAFKICDVICNRAPASVDSAFAGVGARCFDELSTNGSCLSYDRA
jgi:hypothetical protein